MEKVETFKIENKTYYRCDDLMVEYPEIFKGCINSRSYISQHKVTKFVYAKLQKGQWIISNGKSCRFDKVLIRKLWFDKVYPDKDKKIIEYLPEIVELEDSEKFIDNDDNIIEIEVRGDRKFDKCYFKVKDVSDGFRIKNLHETIIDNRRDGYVEGKHYKYFYSKNPGGAKKLKVRKLYLTYIGITRVLFCSNKKTADKFMNWASKTLFTIQMGTMPQKNKLVADVMGVTPDVVSTVFKSFTVEVASIYLITIGKVGDLRDYFEIDEDQPDDAIISKWGRTTDPPKRLKDHERKYGKIKGSDIRLNICSFVDPMYVSKAEKDIADMFKDEDYKLDYPGENELAVIPKNRVKWVRNQYVLISDKYAGTVKKFSAQMQEKENEIAMLKKDHENEIAMLKKDYEAKLKDSQHEKELVERDCEIKIKDIEGKLKDATHQKEMALKEDEIKVLKNKRKKGK